jgi:hypothetical protein
MKNAKSLHLFMPPDVGDELLFDDGSVALVCQDIGCGWHLLAAGERICKSGFDMNTFIRNVLDECRLRQVAA